MRVPRDERLLVSVAASRKGNGYRGEDAPCEIGITIICNPDGSEDLAIRSVDQGGVPTMVARINRENARILAETFLENI